MIRAKDVKHEKWTKTKVLYDNGVFSAVWGTYKGNEGCLGTRWNGEKNEVGYPNLGKNPLWFVEAEFLILPILTQIRSLLIYDKCTEIDNRDSCLENTLNAIKEYIELKGENKDA